MKNRVLVDPGRDAAASSGVEAPGTPACRFSDATCYAGVMHRTIGSALALLLVSGVVACGGSQAQSVPAEAAPGPAATAEPAAAPEESAPSRPSLTSEECEASGGTIVGDIGDGAIHRPEYRCPSGAAPSGSIKAPEGGPMAIEGSVCCPK